MRVIRLLVLVLLIWLPFVPVSQTVPDLCSQVQSANHAGLQDLPLPKGRFSKPKITLQAALKLAEGYIKRNKIEISSFYLREVRLIESGGERDVKEPAWFFWWIHESGTLGNYVEIIVSMDSKITRVPSM
jgi:hypothetical protein